MKHTSCFASFLCGSLVGAAIAVLVTPKSGPAMRRDIRDLANKGKNKLKDEIDKIH